MNRLIHYSSEKINVLEKREYDQNLATFQHKPKGLWISIEGEDDWKNWCIAEKFELQCLTFCYEIILKEDANILYLKTAEEIFDFTKKYSLIQMISYLQYDTDQIDWLKVKQDYQGIIISPYQWVCRLSSKSTWYYGWDCASGCIWDLEAIKEFKFLEETKLEASHDS